MNRSPYLYGRDVEKIYQSATDRMAYLVKDAISRVASEARERVEQDGVPSRQAAREAARKVMREVRG